MSAPYMTAIAALTQDRAIGAKGKMAWHLPEDFKWFKRTTLGHIVIMGRKTFESLGKPLPGRENIVLTRGPSIPGVQTLASLDTWRPPRDGRRVFLIGGAQIYKEFLPLCKELLLSEVHEAYIQSLGTPFQPDAFFPPYTHLFKWKETLLEFPEFTVQRYIRIS